MAGGVGAGDFERGGGDVGGLNLGLREFFRQRESNAT